MTIIFLWDELKDYILASKYDPLSIGTDEAGLAKVDDDDELSVYLEKLFRQIWSVL